MTLPASYPITLAQVCAEFGAPSNTPLGSFLRGGAYVPNAAPNLGVPTAKPINLGDLLGASAAVYGATLAPTYLSKVRVGTGTATTAACTVTVTGSAGSLTYAWTRTSGSTAITINSPSGASTTFNSTFLSLISRTAYFKCTVTDSILGTTSTTDVQVDMEAT